MNGKIYFASDFHFGIPDHASSLVREKRFVSWLEMAQKDAAEIYLMGDLFDFSCRGAFQRTDFGRDYEFTCFESLF